MYCCKSSPQPQLFISIFIFSFKCKVLDWKTMIYYINILVDSMKSGKYMEAIVTGITYNKSILNEYRWTAHILLCCGKFVQPAQKTACNSKIFLLLKKLRLPACHPFSRPLTLQDQIQSLKTSSTIIICGKSKAREVMCCHWDSSVTSLFLAIFLSANKELLHIPHSLLQHWRMAATI